MGCGTLLEEFEKTLHVARHTRKARDFVAIRGHDGIERKCHRPEFGLLEFAIPAVDIALSVRIELDQNDDK